MGYKQAHTSTPDVRQQFQAFWCTETSDCGFICNQMRLDSREWPERLGSCAQSSEYNREVKGCRYSLKTEDFWIRNPEQTG